MADGLVEWAYRSAERYMPALGRRWAHVQAVGALAQRIAPAFGDDGEVLVAAAYVHDIGYADELVVSGFHPLDGACRVRDAGYPVIASLVAHHSGARHEAQLRGLDDFIVEFPWVPGPLQQAVTFCDLTTGPDGRPMALHDRIEDIVGRYGADHVTARAILAGRPELEQACDVTRSRAVAAGVQLDDHRMAGSSLLM